MRIAISSTGPSLDSRAEERFGRCAYFIIFDDDKDGAEVVQNEGSKAAEGSGIKSTRMLLQNGVDVVLTGRVGPKAMHALLAGGVAVYTGIGSTVEETLKRYRNGKMTPLGVANAALHAGKKAAELDAK